MADMTGNQTHFLAIFLCPDTSGFHLQPPTTLLSAFSPRQSKNGKTKHFLSSCPLLSHSAELASADRPLFWLAQHHHLVLLSVVELWRPSPALPWKDLIHCSLYRETFSFSVPCVASQHLEFFFFPVECHYWIYVQSSYIPRENAFYSLCTSVFYVALRQRTCSV